MDRPFLTVRLQVSELLVQDVTHPLIRRLPPASMPFDQWADNVTALANASRRVHTARQHLQTALPQTH